MLQETLIPGTCRLYLGNGSESEAGGLAPIVHEKGFKGLVAESQLVMFVLFGAILS